MILDGYSGSILNNAVVPDSNETYMSPLYVDLDGDNNYQHYIWNRWRNYPRKFMDSPILMIY